MQIRQHFITRNECFIQGRKRSGTKGLVFHSTATPGIMAAAWYVRWNRTGLYKAVHAFVDDKEIVQHLPWDMRAWHIGTNEGNGFYIGVEACEDRDHTKEYFLKTWDNMVKLFAFLCKQEGLTERDIYSHREAHRLGWGSNHGDPEHWIGKFGYTMDMFRTAVAQELKGRPGTGVPVIKLGDKGEAVKLLQEQLIRVGFPPTDNSVDGSFGPKTETALLRFQANFKLIVDGIAGPQTWGKLTEIIEELDAEEVRKAEEAAKAEKPLPDGKMIRVVVGSNRFRSNAERTKAKLEADGYDNVFFTIYDPNA